MTDDLLDAVEREIERLRRRHAVLLRELPQSREMEARWVLETQCLHWFVAFDREVLEPDIDVEITAEVLVVRARPISDTEVTLLGLLPVPSGFAIEDPTIHCGEDSLDIRIRRRGQPGGAP